MTTFTAIEKKLLHYTGKAIADYQMIQRGDRVMVCLSGGKDSFTMLTILKHLQQNFLKHLNYLMGWDLQNLTKDKLCQDKYNLLLH